MSVRNLPRLGILGLMAGWCVSHLAGLALAQDPADSPGVDWARALRRFDPEWQRLPKKWNEAPFLGNGEQGTLMVQVDERTLRFDVGCSAAHDHRPFAEDDLSEKHVEVLNRGRLPIGFLRLEASADVVAGTAQLSLWDAEATGVFESEQGAIQWRSIVHATEPVIYIEFDAEGDLAESRIRFVAQKALNSRAERAKLIREPAHPPAVAARLEDGVQTSVQNLAHGGQTAVAWKVQRAEETTRVWLSVLHSYPEEMALARAVEAVRSASGAETSRWFEAHRDWWHDYYPASFVSTGDSYWDSYYWIQQYKIACATRDSGWIIDNQGPWLQRTAWNATWWNLNAQLSHLGGHQANRRGMVSALGHRLGLNRDALVLNVAEEFRDDSAALGRSVSGWDLLGHAGQPGGREPMDRNIGRECGNLLWALHCVDMEVRYWADEELRDTTLLPLLVKAVNYYRHFLEKGEDGLWHLPITYSPEYRSARDCTYDLDLLRWGVGRLIEISAEVGWTEEAQPLMGAWRDIHKNLVPVHANESGRMIGSDVALTGGHRHWSHLLAVYPLRTLTPESDSDRALIEKSLIHWRSFDRGIAGYAHTASSCMASMLGDGDQALRYLEQLVPYLHANTFYSEIGLPVMETPLHGATAIQEMLFQSWGGCLRVFPAVPASWPNAQFGTFRGEGGFLVSARRVEGVTQWVQVEATVGGATELLAGIAEPQWSAEGDGAVEELSNGRLALRMKRGCRVRIWPKEAATPVKFVLESVAQKGPGYRFGLQVGPKTRRK